MVSHLRKGSGRVSVRIRRVRRYTCSDGFLFLDQPCLVTCGRGYAALWETYALLSLPSLFLCNLITCQNKTLTGNTLITPLSEAVEPLPRLSTRRCNAQSGRDHDARLLCYSTAEGSRRNFRFVRTRPCGHTAYNGVGYLLF